MYPPFLEIYNGNRTIGFNVTDESVAGKQFFFKILLKEVGANAIGYPYYCTVTIDPLPEIEDGEESGGSGGDD